MALRAALDCDLPRHMIAPAGRMARSDDDHTGRPRKAIRQRYPQIRATLPPPLAASRDPSGLTPKRLGEDHLEQLLPGGGILDPRGVVVGGGGEPRAVRAEGHHAQPRVKLHSAWVRRF